MLLLDPVYIVYQLEVWPISSKHIPITWPKDMRAKDFKFYCIFEQIEYEAEGGKAKQHSHVIECTLSQLLKYLT